MTEVEDAHWRGTVERTLEEHERRLQAINGNIAAGVNAINQMSVTIAGLATRVALISSFGGLVGSAVVGVAVYFLTH